MHDIQKRLLQLGQTHDLKALSLRQIGRMIGESHPQKIKHHMQQLNLLPAAPDTKAGAAQSQLISIPLLGLANCGEATVFADAKFEKYLQISKKLIHTSEADLFAVQAIGRSMNRADIHGSNIDNGDYVVVNPNDKDFKNGDYVLSVINGLANIKKFVKDELAKQIILVSESTEDYPPIYIHEDDMAHYMTSGKVVAVLKKPREQISEIVFDRN